MNDKLAIFHHTSIFSAEALGTSGFSTSNLWFMRQMYLEYRDYPNLLQLVRENPWGQNIAIMTKVKNMQAREYYLRMSAEPAALAEQADRAMKDVYALDFLGITKPVVELCEDGCLEGN